MQKKYKSILLFKKIYKENDLFVKFLADNDEIITGIVYGGLSKKKINIYQLGYFLDINVSKYGTKPASITSELAYPYIANIIHDKYKLQCLLSITSILNVSIIEGQKIQNIYQISYDFINKLISNKTWIIYYFYYLMNLLQIIGYEIDYKKNINYKYFSLDTLAFESSKSKSSILFPHDLLENKIISREKFNLINNFFLIFESVFLKNHLSFSNLELPNHYQLFKKLIMDYTSGK